MPDTFRGRIAMKCGGSIIVWVVGRLVGERVSAELEQFIVNVNGGEGPACASTHPYWVSSLVYVHGNFDEPPAMIEAWAFWRPIVL